MQLPGNQVNSAVFSGNANVDHAFVVYNLALDGTVPNRATSLANTRVEVGNTIAVFNLRDAITKNAPRVGFVMDPYLDKTAMKATASELVTSLNGDRRQAAGKDTDFLAFDGIHPSPDPPVTDHTGKTDAQRKVLVRNV